MVRPALQGKVVTTAFKEEKCGQVLILDVSDNRGKVFLFESIQDSE